MLSYSYVQSWGHKDEESLVACEAQVYSLNILELPCKGVQSIQEPKRERSEFTAGGIRGECRVGSRYNFHWALPCHLTMVHSLNVSTFGDFYLLVMGHHHLLKVLC